MPARMRAFQPIRQDRHTIALDGDIRRAFVDGFADLVETIEPPILKFITNPLTLERSYHGKDMPILSFDVIDGADYIEVTCSPKALGSGRWAALKIFTYPTLDEIEGYFMECVLEAGSQHCPPVIIGVGIGGSFDHAAKMAKGGDAAQDRHVHPDPMVRTWRCGCSRRSTRPASVRWAQAATPPRSRSMSISPRPRLRAGCRLLQLLDQQADHARIKMVR